MEEDIILGNVLKPEEGLIIAADPLTLDIDDDELVRTTDKRIKDSRQFFKTEYNLFERRKKNYTYIFGRQIYDAERKNELKIYEARYLDNVLYEIQSSIKPLGMSRLPDMIVTPGSEDPEKAKTAEDLTKVIDTDIKKRQNRTVLGITFKHLPVYLTGIIKCVWNARDDDFEFRVVHPDYVDVDHTCQTNNADDMKFVSEIIPTTLQQLLIRFPTKRDEILKEASKDGIRPDSNGDVKKKDLASEIKIREVWFDWQIPVKKDTSETPDEDKNEADESYEEVCAVLWKYHDLILKKIKNPNFDYEGQQKWMVYDDPSMENSKHEVNQAEMMDTLITGQPPEGVTREQVFRNYFSRPRKPYFFMGYDQFRKIPYDETSPLEQNIRNQQALDKAGKRIIEKQGERVKHIFSKDGGLEQKHLQDLDLDDPRQDILLEGDVTRVHSEIRPEIVTPQEFQFMDSSRTRMYSLAGASAVRGEVQSDVATTNQIAREADYTRADDLVDDTINAACEWMADWSLQMIKLRYSEGHFRKILGAQGKVTFTKLKSDMIEDGMEVMIKSSGTDKVKTKNQAMDMAKIGFIDPYHFFKDIGVDDPEGRVADLIMFQTNPASYAAKFQGLGDNLQQQAATLNGTPQQPEQPPIGQAPPQPAQPELSVDQGQPSQENPQVPPIAPVPDGSTRLL